jgi:methylglutamate dehydrogenase subunit D
VADTILQPRLALMGEITAHALRIAPVHGLRWSAIHVRRGGQGILAERLQAGFGLAVPQGPAVTLAGPASLIWIGAERLNLVQEAASTVDVATTVGDAGDVTDLTSGQVTVELAGATAQAVLRKLVAIDLHPRAFGPGSAATTLCGHFGVTLWQTDTQPSFRLATHRSYAQALWHSLEDAARGF